MNVCIQCKSDNITIGKFRASDEKCGVVFAPENIKFWSFSVYGGIFLKDEAYACLNCGLVWSFANANELANFVHKNCKSLSSNDKA